MEKIFPLIDFAKSCVVFGSCYENDVTPVRGAYYVAADGGYDFCSSKNITPDYFVGDLDSIRHIPREVTSEILPTVKNETDTYAAVKQGLSLGYELFVIYGGLGGRFDHTFANCQILADIAKQGKQGILADKFTVVTVVSRGKITFNLPLKSCFSVFAYDESCKCSIENAKYPLERVELKNTFPLGVSNESIGLPVTVKNHAGLVMLVLNIGI
jgi:thiamine pyrophosphokinase